MGRMHSFTAAGIIHIRTVSAITTDDRGFVVIAFGSAAAGGSVVIGPGALQ